MAGMAMAAPQDGYYVNGHRFELTLSKTDAAYFNFLADMKTIGWDFSKVIIVENNQFADYQDAIDEGNISKVLKDNAHLQVGSLIPGTVIPISNNGTEGPSETVSDTADDILYESTNTLATPSVSVESGTSEADAKALLDATVGVVGTKGENGTASIAWSIAGYSAATAGDYTATGVLTLPDGWSGSAPNVTATVTVQGIIPPAYASTNDLEVTSVSVDNGTSEADAIALLDATVGVVGTKGENGIASIAWSIAGYNETTAGDYTATGVLTLPEGWTGSAPDVTADVTVKAPAGPANAVEAIEMAIANFAPASGSGTFTGSIPSVKVAGNVTVEYVTMVPATTKLNSSSSKSSFLDVNIQSAVISNLIVGTVTANNFPFAEIIVGPTASGTSLVSTGALSSDADNYYIQLTNVDCPQSLLDIFTKAANLNSSYGMSFSNQKLTCKIKISKTSGRVVSVDNITVVGTTKVTKSTLNMANGSYSNTFSCSSFTLTY